MKNYLKAMFLFALLGIVLPSVAQTYAVVDYMKVPQGGDGNYMQVEEEWKKVHQARVDAGMIQNWQFYSKMFAGSTDEYNYMTVAIYDDVTKMEDPIPWDWIKENYTESERNAMMKKTNKARVLVKTEVYRLMESASGDTPPKYIFMQRWKAKPGKMGEYKKFEKEMAKPYFQEYIDKGGQASWSVWSKYLGEGDWHGIWANGHANFGDWEKDHSELSTSIMESLLKEGQTIGEVQSNMGKLRGSVGQRELWVYIDYVGPSEEE
jgi:hypothetical protein